MTIKSFRGMMQEDQVDTVPLSTNTGSIGYKITKMQIMPVDTGGAVNTSNEATIQIYSINSSADTQAGLTHGSVDFSDNTLLGVGVFSSQAAAQTYPEDMTIIFDNMVFNQDIYITAKAEQGTNVNYYIELEATKLALDENTVATLKDIRNITGR